MSSSDRPDPHQIEYCYRFRPGSPGEFDEARMELRIDGRVVRLQRRPLDLLHLLLKSEGRLLTKEEALRTLWNGRTLDVYSDATLANAVSKLRQALGPALAPRVVTVARLGFRLDGEVERIATGTVPDATFTLGTGSAVPDRADVELVRRLSQTRGQAVWLGSHRRSGERRVYKFAFTGERLAGLKREYTLQRYLQRTLGERSDLVRVLDKQFREPPFWLECEPAGMSLDAWAAEPDGAATRLAASPRAERIAMFLAVAEALAAVHGVRVLHSDVKPSNILISGDSAGWRLRLADFGSARLLDPERLAALEITALGMTSSHDGALLGTPRYLAPELAAGQAPDIASDVYALGFVLYQWLAGDFRRPMAPGWQRDIGDDLLAADIARATDGDPALRFASVAELARQLRDLPRREAERAEQSREAEHRAVLRAEAERAFDRFIREDLIAAANPAASGRADITVAEAVEAAADRIDARFAAHPPEVRAGLHASMQGALSELSRTKAAIAAGERAVAAWRQAATFDAEALADVRLRLAIDLVQLSNLDRARAVSAELEHDAPRALREERVFRARWLYLQSWLTGGELALEASLAQGDAAWQLVQHLTETEAPWRDKIGFALADTLALLGRNVESEALCRRLLAEQTERHGADHPRPMVTRVVLGRALLNQHRHAEASAVLREAIAGLTASLGAQRRMTLDARGLLAEIWFKEQDYGAAAAEWADVHRGMAAMLGEGSSYAVTIQTNLAVALHRGGQPERAETCLREALRHVQAFTDGNAPQAQQIRYALADCLIDLGRAAAAAPLLDGLDAASLNLAQQETDWPSRLASLRARGRGRGAAVTHRPPTKRGRSPVPA